MTNKNKIAVLITAFTITNSSISSAQTVDTVSTIGKLSTFDFNTGNDDGAWVLQANHTADCVDASSVTNVAGLRSSSTHINQAEYGTLGFICTQNWTSGDAPVEGEHLAFDLDFSESVASGDLSAFEFTIAHSRSDTVSWQFLLYNELTGNQVVSDTGTFSAKYASPEDSNFDIISVDLSQAVSAGDSFRGELSIYGAREGDHVIFDNASYVGHVTCVPEPSSSALLGLGAFGLLVRRKR